MSKKQKSGNYYIALNRHDDPIQAEYPGFSEDQFNSDEDAIKYYSTNLMNNGDLKVAKIIATSKSQLIKCEEKNALSTSLKVESHD